MSATPEAIGPYRIETRLGAGATGSVFRARHVETGQVVALKTVEAPSSDALSRLRNEIHTIRRLDHPGVVRFLSEGVVDGLPWYAMELLDGASLRSFNHGIWHDDRRVDGTRRQLSAETLASVLTLFRRLCGPLALLHGEGFVYRDLHPDNVFIRRDGSPVLLDFGLAARLRTMDGRDIINVGGALVGTCWYMAPEQINGDLVDARADLYALGCLLYESVTGTPPFTGSSADEVLDRHLHDEVVPPSMRMSSIPRALDALVLGLLAKEPRERIGYAVDVSEALGELGAKGWERAHGGGGRAYVYRPRLAGRREWIRKFDHYLRGLLDGQGGFIALGGESGIGKTRLASELATRAHLSGACVITAECVPPGTSTSSVETAAIGLLAFQPVLEAVADRCRDTDEAEVDRILGPRGKVLAAYQPALAALAGAERHPDPPPLEGAEARNRVFRSLRDTIVAFAGEQPLVLVVDDLQWADELSLSFLLSCPPDFLHQHSILIVGTYRPEEQGALLTELVSRARDSFMLDRLDEESVACMVADMLALPLPPAGLARQLMDVSEGVPFFVSEHLRAAVEEGRVTRPSASGWRWRPTMDVTFDDLPFPDTLQGLVSRRLVALEPATSRMLDCASCLGRVVDPGIVATMASLDAREAFAAAQELRQRGIMHEIAGGHLQFTHDKLREAVYERLTSSRRRALHQEGALAIEAVLGGRDDDTMARWYPILARHWSLADVPDRCLDYLDKAAEAAFEAAAYREASSFFGSALETDGRTGTSDFVRRARWHRRLGEAAAALGDRPLAARCFAAALRCLGFRVPGSSLGWVGATVVEAVRQASHLIAGVRGSDPAEGGRMPHGEAAIAASLLARWHYFSMEALPVIGAGLAAANHADRASDAFQVTNVYCQLGYSLSTCRLSRLGQHYFRKTRVKTRQTGDIYGLASVLFLEGADHCGKGRWSAARQRGLEALELTEHAARPYETEHALTVLCHTDYCAGRFEQSREWGERMLASASAHDNEHHKAWGLYCIGRVDLALGQVDEAIGLFEEARETILRGWDRPSAIICGGLLALALVRQGSLRRARMIADETYAAAHGRVPSVFTSGHGYAGLAEAYLTLWDAERNRGRDTAEERHLRRAAWRAGAYLRAFAALFPIGRPAALTLQARAQRLVGRRRRARRTATRAIACARRLHAPFDEAFGHWELAQAEPRRSAAARHRDAAREGFTALGCINHVALVEGSGEAAGMGRVPGRPGTASSTDRNFPD